MGRALGGSINQRQSGGEVAGSPAPAVCSVRVPATAVATVRTSTILHDHVRFIRDQPC